LSELQTLVTPDTLFRWYWQGGSKMELQPTAWTGPPAHHEKDHRSHSAMALENPSWGYTRIRGALANLGHQVGRGTIANVLEEHDIEPAPERDRHTDGRRF
jgi:hypothetical protein